MMTAQQITKSRAKLAGYAASVELDRLALPLIKDVGIAAAYAAALAMREKIK